MFKRRLLSLILAVAMVGTMFTGMTVFAATDDGEVRAAAAATLTVDPNSPESDTNFNTISGAVAKAKELNPQSEADRVTINVTPGNYEEHVDITNAKFITLQQTPGTSGKVDLHWYYCTGYCAGDCDLNGMYDPKINWSDKRTWTGYNPGDEQFPEYKLGQVLKGAGLDYTNVTAEGKEKFSKVDVKTISYYDTDGVAHRNVEVKKAHLGDFTDQGAMFIYNSSNIVVKDFNIVNSVPVMVTEGEKRVGVAPQEERTADYSTNYVLPHRDNLVVCDEDTAEETTDAIDDAFAVKDDNQKVKKLDALKDLTAENSAYLARSSKFNERGHAISTKGADMITFENVRARGNQDSVYIDGGRHYFKGCDLIGGTDYIYGAASAIFDSCELGAAGFTDKEYGATITAANHDAANPYGYLFYNCTLYNVLSNIKTSSLGRPWRQDAQITFYNLAVDDKPAIGKSAASVSDKGWDDMSGASAAKARFFEYGTHKLSDNSPVDTSKRLKNLSKEEGGQGMGTVLDEWQILEFNPYNYFNSDYWLTNKKKPEWDPMNFGEKLANVKSAIDSINLTIPENEQTVIDLPEAPAGVTYKWESNSPNVQVSSDGTKITVMRPAAGEPSIESSIILYAMDNTTKAGSKVELPVTITPTTNKTDVFNIPVKISSSLTLKEDNDFTITISKNGATIKTQVITMKAGQTEVTDTIENVPANADGIEYNVKIVSTSNDLSILSPEGGVTTITGITGQDVELNISAQMVIDESVNLGITYNSTDKNKVYDLIDLAQKAGADAKALAGSDIVTVEYTLNVTNPATSGDSFIDLVHGTPTENVTNGKLDNRFVLAKLGHWTQLDTVDNTQGFSGSNNSEHQVLNVSGKFDGTTPNKVAVTINYKDQTVSLDANGSGNGKTATPVTYGSFPSGATKGDLKMAIYAGKEEFNIEGVKVIYKKLVEGELPETPEGHGIYPFTDVVGGNQCDGDVGGFKFVDGVDPKVAGLFEDANDSSVMDTKFTEHYKNYVGGTGDKATHPTIELDAPAGKYKIYYVGYNNEKNIQAKVNGKTYTAGGGTPLAAQVNNTGYVLKYYTIDIEMTQDDSIITFDSSEEWLPDTYCVVVVGSAEELGAPDVTPAPATEAPAPATESPAPETEAPAPATEAPGTATEAPAPATESPAPETEAPAPATEAPATATPTPAATAEPMEPIADIDFTKMTQVPVYSAESKEGFVSVSDAIMPDAYRRKVSDTGNITIGADGAVVTESNGDYLYNKSSEDYNYGGLIYRVDTGKPGAYHLEVEVADGANTRVAPTGMDASRLTSTNNWDNCLHVPRTVSAKWEGNVWSYDFATGEDFVEIEVEPTKLPTADAPLTVGIKSLKITPLGVNPAGDKPTIHILGDSTQKSYSFNETISSWGQMLGEFFDPSKVTVVNYSMGGRAMKSNYNEGRTMEPLIRGKAGDYVFIHSAHNDETVSTGRFVRGASVGNNLEENNANYDRWLNMYVKMIKARGMIPVLVTAMPRTGDGKYSENSAKPNGFNPDSPGRMRAKATEDSEVGLVELYAGAKDYIDKLDAHEVLYIYHTYESGETPANNNANGSEGMKHDGTHYREAAAKMWCRIMLQSIYDQSVASTDTYTDKNIMADLVSYMPASVQDAAKSGDWTAVFPEMASDVSGVDVVPGATKQAEANYYYRNNIEKALQIGALHKDKDNNFKPTQTITVGEFARGAEKVFGLPENTLNSYALTYDELQKQNAAPIEAASIDEETASAAEGEVTVTVEQPSEGGKVVVYNESEHDVAYGDVPASITAEQPMVDNEYFTLTAPKDITTKNPGNDSSVSFEDGKITGNYVYYRNKNDAEVIYTAKATGKLTIYASFHAERPVELVNVDDKSDIQSQSGGGKTSGSLTFDVQAGKTYKLYQSGSDQKLYGVKYETEAIGSETSIKATAGDSIRVSATAAEGYTLNSILVGGESVSTSREYTFTLEGDTTVSAKFDKEPEMVEQTLIASDAALTREAMAAILYDAYTKANEANGKWITNAKVYMSQMGEALSPDDPNYDPNLSYNGGTYMPLTGWGALEDTDQINTGLYAKTKAAYNLGLVRTEEGIVRGKMQNGTKLEPKAEVTRAKAAKALVFCFILGQLPTDENHLIYMENQAALTVADIAAPNPAAPTTPFTGVSDLPTPVPATPTPVPTQAPTAAPAETATPAPAETATPAPAETATPAPGETATPAPTATPQPLDDQKFDGSAPADVVITVPDTVKDIKGIKVNGVEIAPSNYTFTDGKITFTQEFLQSLPAGETAVVIEAADGTSYSLKINVSNTEREAFGATVDVTGGTATLTGEGVTKGAAAADLDIAEAAADSITSYTTPDGLLLSDNTVITEDGNITVTARFAGTTGDAIDDKPGEAITIFGKPFTKFIRVRSANSKPKSLDDLTFFESTGATDENGNPTSFNCTVLDIAPHVDGEFKIYYRRQNDGGTSGTPNQFTPDDGKDVKLATADSAALEGATWDLDWSSDDGAWGYGTKTWTLVKDNPYALWAGGTTGTIYGYEFIPAGATQPSEPTEAPAQPTEEAQPTTAPAEPTDAPEQPTAPPVSGDGYSILEGSLVAVEVTPDEGKTNVTITVTAKDNSDIPVTDSKFIMPSQDVTVKVVCEEPPAETPAPTETAAPATDTPAPTPTATTRPLEDQKFDASAPGDVVVTLPESVSEVKSVTANGIQVSENSYKVENGKITFTREFLSSLPNGTTEIIIEDAQGNTYSVKINITNNAEATGTPAPEGTPTPGEPTSAPTPTRRPSGLPAGGSAPNSNFSTGGTSAVTPRPAATAEPTASGEPEAPTTAPAEIPTTAPVQGSSQIFEDVPADHWAYAYIMDLYNSGIINGETATLFAPDDQITRAEFTKMAVILFGITPGGETTFTDVAPTDWYAPYVAAGQAEGIINGTTSTTFSPNDNITREQIAAIVGRRLDLSSTWSMSYSDVAEIEEYAQPYVAALSEQGILTGSDGMFKPKDPATRAEAAAIMSRVKNR